MFPSLCIVDRDGVENQNQTNQPEIKRERSNYCTTIKICTLLFSNSLLRSNEYNVNICNKQPQMGCVNTSGGVSTRAVCDPLYYAFINKWMGMI